MDHFSKLKRQVQSLVVLCFVLCNLTVATIALGLDSAGFNLTISLAGGLVAGVLLAFVLSSLIANKVLEPVKKIWQGILHVTSKSTTEVAPNLDTIKMGRELVTSLLLQVYELGSSTAQHDDGSRRENIVQATNIVSHMPIPLFVFNKEQLVTNASDEALEYCHIESSQLFGKALYDSVKLEFPSENTLEQWIKNCQEQKVTDRAYWERVRVLLPGEDKKYKSCDIAAYYNRDNPGGAEFIVTMFDKTDRYEQDDSDMSFVALAVHELRTPLTMLRGYIEVFTDELGGSLNEEMTGFMHKMDVSAKQLTAFVNNILNVSRIDENALTLRLTEADWPKTLRAIIDDLQLKAKVHQKEIKLEIGDNIPTVAVDKVSIYEVVNNLVDNAIKYSGESKEIVIKSQLGKDGQIETTVQDFGVGIPESVVANLFEKFYRNHRTKNQIGGTGLGLFLSKALVNAQGGQVWVSSKEGQGSTFGFSLVPYTHLSDDHKESENKEITRTAHGWIKNHSMYRR